MDPLAILADTPAEMFVCGAAFAQRGARTLTAISPVSGLPKAGAADVLGLATGIGGLSLVDGRARIRAAVLALRQAGWPLGFLHARRGDTSSLGTSLEELLALGIVRVWILAGIVADPDGLGAGCAPVGRIARAFLDEGTPAVANQVRFERARGCRTVLCEAETQRQLRIVARLLRDREIAEPREMLAGSPVLARELAGVLVPDPGPTTLSQTEPFSRDQLQRLRAALGKIPADLVPASAPHTLSVGSRVAPEALQALGGAIVEILGHLGDGEVLIRLTDGPHAGLPLSVRCGSAG